MSSKPKKPAAPRKKANGYKMPAPIPLGEVIHDAVGKKKWRIGPSIGVGGFGEIYSACDHESSPKKGTSGYPFVIKIEPHENGPLFVEKHFYVRNANKDEITKYMKSMKLPSLGMPTYFGNGSHECNGVKYRYLVLERYGKDIWNIFLECGRKFSATTVFLLGLQMLEVLEYIHSRGYVHADLKGANILLGLKKGSEHQAFLVDFGLATRVNDKEFKPDPKCAHNGTIEYTSRDAHLGVATMRGDLEILGYNMLQWISGELPWEKSLKQPKLVQDQKETFMRNVRAQITKNYPDVPEALIKFFEYINTLKPKDVPDYTKCKSIFESYLKSEGKNRNSPLDFTTKKVKANNKRLTITDSEDDSAKVPKKIKKTKTEGKIGDAPKLKKITKVKPKEVTDSDNCENEQPNEAQTQKKIVKKRIVKRKSIEPSLVVKIKKAVTTKATPPVKKNHANMATQTSIERKRKSPRQVSFDSPVSEIIGEKKRLKGTNESANSSGDLFDDSFTLDGKKKRRLIRTDEEITVKKVVKKITTTKVKSWKNLPSITNGRSPPK